MDMARRMRRNIRVVTGETPGLLFLALCFLLGIIAGQLLSARISFETAAELRQYLQDYLVLQGDAGRAWAATALLYLRYPLLALLLGYSSLALAALPVLSIFMGAGISYSVCSFTTAAGNGGLLLAFAAIGLRCLVTIPCFLMIAAGAFHRACRRKLGAGYHISTSAPSGETIRRVFLPAVLLLGGIVLDCWLSPWLLQKAVAWALV